MFALLARCMAFAFHWNLSQNCTPTRIQRWTMPILPNAYGAMCISNQKRKLFEYRKKKKNYIETLDLNSISNSTHSISDVNSQRNHLTIRRSAVLLNSFWSHCTSCSHKWSVMSMQHCSIHCLSSKFASQKRKWNLTFGHCYVWFATVFSAISVDLFKCASNTSNHRWTIRETKSITFTLAPNMVQFTIAWWNVIKMVRWWFTAQKCIQPMTAHFFK